MKGNSSIFWAPHFPLSPSRFPFFYGWIIMGVGTLSFISSMPGQTSGVSVFIDHLITHLDLTRVHLSLAYFLGTLFGGLLLPWSGRLYDRYGARKCVFFATINMGLALILLSQSDRIAAFISFNIVLINRWSAAFITVLTGFFLIRFIGQGFLWVMSQNMMGKWFDKKRGLIMAISGMISTFAFSLTPKGFNALIEWLGWRGAWLFLGLSLIFGVALIIWLLFRENPEDCGLVMDGDNSPVKEHNKNSDILIVREFTLKQAIKTYSFWLINLNFAYSAVFSTGYTFHVISIGEELGLNKAMTLNLFIPMAVVGVATNFLTGWIADKTRLKYVLILMAVASAIAPAGMLMMPSVIGKIFIVLGIGIPAGCWQVLNGVSWPRYFGRLHLGVIAGLSASITVISSSLGPVIFSLSKQYLGQYEPIFIFSLFLPIAIAIGGFWMENPQRKLIHLKNEQNDNQSP